MEYVYTMISLAGNALYLARKLRLEKVILWLVNKSHLIEPVLTLVSVFFRAKYAMFCALFRAIIGSKGHKAQAPSHSHNISGATAGDDDTVDKAPDGVETGSVSSGSVLTSQLRRSFRPPPPPRPAAAARHSSLPATSSSASVLASTFRKWISKGWVQAWLFVIAVSVPYLFATGWVSAKSKYETDHYKYCVLGSSRTEKCKDLRKTSLLWATIEYTYTNCDPIGGAFFPVYRGIVHPIVASPTTFYTFVFACCLVLAGFISYNAILRAANALGVQVPGISRGLRKAAI